MLKIEELSATPFGRSSRPTISTTNAWRVGISSELFRPSKAASPDIGSVMGNMAAESLLFASVPVPRSPVGVGAQSLLVAPRPGG